MASCRLEMERRYPLANGRIVTVIVRDSVTPEDPYLVLTRAKALSVRTGEVFNASRTTRSIKDFLIKTNISI
jgi:hypothetical protein